MAAKSCRHAIVVALKYAVFVVDFHHNHIHVSAVEDDVVLFSVTEKRRIGIDPVSTF